MLVKRMPGYNIDQCHMLFIVHDSDNDVTLELKTAIFLTVTFMGKVWYIDLWLLWIKWHSGASFTNGIS